MPAPQQGERHPAAGSELLGLLVGLGADDPAGDRDARRLGALGLGGALAVQRRDLLARGVDEVRERVGEAQLGGP